jgi:hypothetical protein
MWLLSADCSRAHVGSAELGRGDIRDYFNLF